MRKTGFMNLKLSILALAAISVALNGCATWDEGTTGLHNNVAASAPALPPDLGQFFGAMPAGSVAAFDSTPWGSQVELQLAETYYAASGRECRTVHLHFKKMSPDSTDRAELACKVDAGQWQPVRAVTQLLK